MPDLRKEAMEAEKRLADAWGIYRSCFPVADDGLVDEDAMEAIEAALDSVGLNGLFSALGHAFAGSGGCKEPSEWEADRERLLEELRKAEDLPSAAPAIRKQALTEHLSANRSAEVVQIIRKQERERIKRRFDQDSQIASWVKDRLDKILKEDGND